MSDPRRTFAGSASEGPLYVGLTARPTRVGVFLPLDDNFPWERMYEIALASQSRLWGGEGNLVFPATPDIEDSELFWALAERFDADYYVSASFSRRDLGDANPSWLTEWEQTTRASIDAQLSAFSAAVRESEFQRLLDEPAQWWTPDNGFLALLERRLAPFHHSRQTWSLGRLAVNDPQALREAGTGLSPLSDIADVAGWPALLANPDAGLDATRNLLITAEAGRIPSGLVEGIQQTGATTVEPWHIENEGGWQEVLFGDRDTPGEPPWRLTAVGLDRYRIGLIERTHPLAVVGDTPWDFALFYALRRWLGGVCWIPQTLAGDESYLMRAGLFLDDAHRYMSEAAIRVVTTSDETFRDGIIKRLNQLPGWREPVEAADWRDILPRTPTRLMEKDRVRGHEPVLMHNGATVTLPTPIPACASEEPGRRLRWITDARVHGWGPLRHGALGTQIIDQPGFTGDHARTGRDAAAYTPTGMLTFVNASYAASTERPTLHPLTLIEEMDFALREDGWRCQASDKGAYAAQSALLFGGFRALAQGLRDQHVRAVLEAFRANDSSAPGKKSSGRRYLTLHDIETVLGDAAAAEAVCRDLTQRGVLTYGLFLKCSLCRSASWYALEEITSEFRCRRCRTVQPVSRDRWLDTIEPVWHYELAEVVRQLLEQNGDLPILAVQDFFPAPLQDEDDIEVAFEIEVFSPGQNDGDQEKSETDIAVRDGSKLWLGEATKADHLRQDGPSESARLKRLSDLADRLAAYGVLLASTQPFRASTIGRANDIFPGPWPKLERQENVQTAPESQS